MMTNHLAKVADLEFVGKETIRKEAEKAINEAISIFEQASTSRVMYTVVERL